METDLLQLFVEAQRGDRECEAALLRALQPLIYGRAMRLLQHHHDAEDAVQNVQVALTAAVHHKTRDYSFPNEQMLYGFVNLITVRQVCKIRQRRLPTSDLDTWLTKTLDPLCLDNTVDEIDQLDDARALLDAIRTLQSKDQKIITQIYMLGLTSTDLADIIPNGNAHTIRGRLMHAKKQLLAAIERLAPQMFRRLSNMI